MFGNKLSFKSRRGVTLLELIVAMSIWLFMSSLTYAMFISASRSWIKVSQKATLLQRFEVLAGKVQREVSGSSRSSVTISPDQSALSFLSASTDNPNQPYQFGAQGRLQWQKFVVYYHDSVSGGVFRTETPLTTPSIRSVVIDSLGGGGINSYLIDGQPIALNVTECDFRLRNGKLVMDVSFKEGRDTLSMSSTNDIRNE